jgi:hypothetical protein
MTGIISDNVGRTSGLVKSAGGGGAWTLIKTLTASSDSALSFVDGTDDVVLDSTYPIYKFVYTNAHPSQQSGDGEEFQFNLSEDTGSSYAVTKTTTFFRGRHTEADASNVAYVTDFDLAQGTGFQTLSANNSGDNDSSNSGEMWLFNPSSTVFVKHFIARSNYMMSAPGCFSPFVAGYGNTTSAVDAVQFKFSAGNIDAGTFKLYGLGDS